jgi:hypothetical protein
MTNSFHAFHTLIEVKNIDFENRYFLFDLKTKQAINKLGRL